MIDLIIISLDNWIICKEAQFLFAVIGFFLPQIAITEGKLWFGQF